jgi:PEP-CTERM motif
MFATSLRGVAAATAILAATSAFAGTNLIQNGDFSSPSEGGSWGNVASGYDGWTTNDPSNVLEIGASGIYGLPAANLGGQNLEVNANTFDTVSYTVSGLNVGATYDLSWDYGGRPGGGAQILDVSFGGVLLAKDTGSYGSWMLNAFQVVATSSSETLTFASEVTNGLPSYGNEITNVSLSAPEPSTWAMMGLGFAGLGFAGLRTRRSVVAAA